MIQNIKLGKLYPHPDNPRKDLGELTELSDSIKTIGVMQNLTVVPRAEKEGTYTVVIGHRRLAAAKLAELIEVPCAIREMTEQEQVATMLLENIQRSDLTVYEQAQGFQMMLDLGDSVTDIATRTGFSKTTVRRRVKLLELDQEKFKDSVERGATLMDFAELDKIKSLDRKNDVLAKIGTHNFQYELKRAIDAEEHEARIDKYIEALSAFASQVDSDNGYMQVKYYSGYSEPNVERPEDAESTEYFFCIDKWGGIRLLVIDDGQEPEEDAEEARRRERRELRISSLKDATARAYGLRKEFIKGVSASKVKKHLADIVTCSAWKKNDEYIHINDELFLELIGVEIGEDEELTLDMVAESVSKLPERALLMMVYCEHRDSEDEGYYASWNIEHKSNWDLDSIYALLKKLGYKMSDEEHSLQDGTHEFFSEEDEQQE